MVVASTAYKTSVVENAFDATLENAALNLSWTTSAFTCKTLNDNSEIIDNKIEVIFLI